MRRKMSVALRAALAAGLGLLVASLTVSAAKAADWGTLEGQVVWGGKELPKAAKIDSSKEPRCPKDLHSQAYVINPKNKGVQWCLVWIVDADNYDNPIPIHRTLRKPKVKKVVLDQPHCMFEPHVTGLYVPEQSLLIKNSAEFPHNVHIYGGSAGPELNRILPPGGQFELEGKNLKPRYLPITVACDIHGWMKGKVGVFNSPYFAVTDKDGKFKIPLAPAGKYRLVIYQETTGWVLGGKNPLKGGGQIITIKDGPNNLGTFECPPAPQD